MTPKLLGCLSGIQVSRVAAGDPGLVAGLQHWLTAAAGIRSTFLSSASGLPAGL